MVEPFSLIDVSTAGAADGPLQPPEDSFVHRGIQITGIQHLESHGVLHRQDVMGLLDRLPARYFERAPLEEIIFSPHKYYCIRQNGKILFVDESEIEARDEVVARTRGWTHGHARIENGSVVLIDEKKSITIYSSLNWDDKHDKQLDKDTALYTLAHELGHTVWASITNGLSPQHEARLLPLIERWKALRESQLARYVDYKHIFTQEFIHGTGTLTATSVEEQAVKEDFAISYEHFLYWQDLQKLDPTRHAILQAIYDAMN